MADFRAILVNSGLLHERTSGHTGPTGHAPTKDNLNSGLEYSWPVTSGESTVVPLVTARRHTELPVTAVTTANTGVVTACHHQKASQGQELRKPGTSGTTVTTEIDVFPHINEEERVAIAIELGGVPEIYAPAFAQLQTQAPPEVPLERWHQFINDAGIFLDRWGDEAERLGWRAEELFGLHPDAPIARCDRMGLLWTLKGERVVELTPTEARLLGGLTFHRKG
jgi:hypothetical protein